MLEDDVGGQVHTQNIEMRLHLLTPSKADPNV